MNTESTLSRTFAAYYAEETQSDGPDANAWFAAWEEGTPSPDAAQRQSHSGSSKAAAASEAFEGGKTETSND